MATLEGLSLSISADVKDLLKGLDTGKKNITDFANTGEASLQTLGDAYKLLADKQKQALAGSADFKRYAQGLKEIGNAKKAVEDLATKGLPDLKRGTEVAGQSLTNLGRIAQDAPFGFIGIQNNINPLLESFQRLKVETGSTAGAFKALLSGLGGAAGIGLAVSLATSALTVLTQQGFFKSTSAAKEAEKANQEFNKSLKEVEAGALSTGAKLQAFINIAKDGNLPLEQRNQALKEANKIFGEYGEKVTLANVATAKITEQTKLFTNALVAQAIATKFADKIADLEIKKKEAQIKLNEDVIASNKQLTASQQRSNAAISGGTGGVGGLGNVSEDAKIAVAQNKVAESSKNLNTINSELTKTQKLFNETVFESTSLLGTLGTKSKETSDKSSASIKTFGDIIAEFRKEVAGLQAQLKQGLITSEAVDEGVVKALTSTIGKLGEIKAPLNVQSDLVFEFSETLLRDNIKKFEKTIGTKFKEEPLVAPIDVKPVAANVSDGSLTFLAESLNRQNLQARLKALGVTRLTPIGIDLPITVATSTAQLEAVYKAVNEQIAAENVILKQLITTGFTDAFSGIGDSISKGILEGNFAGNLFGGLFETLGGSLQAYGKQIIATSKLLATLKKALNVGNFGGSLLVGIGLVALGGLTKGLAGGLKLAGGGFVSGPGSKTSDSIPAQLSRGEFVVRAAAVDKFGVGFLNSINSLQAPTMATGGAVGVGSSPIVSNNMAVDINGQFVITGDSLRLLLERANKTFRTNT
jgi:hypothetical protein